MRHTHALYMPITTDCVLHRVCTEPMMMTSETTFNDTINDWQQTMRARLGIDKSKTWADWVEEEEEEAKLTKTIEEQFKPPLLLGMRLRGGAAECGEESGEEGREPKCVASESAHGQEGDGVGTLTEGGPPGAKTIEAVEYTSMVTIPSFAGCVASESAHGQEGDGVGTLTEGGLPRHASAHGQEGDGVGTLTEGGLPRHASAHGQEDGGGGSTTEDGLPESSEESADEEESFFRWYHPIRAPRAYDLDNCVVRKAVSNALKLQGDMLKLKGDMVRLAEVQAYVFEALSIKPAKKELRPIVETLLYEEGRQAILRKVLDEVRAAGHDGDLRAAKILAFEHYHLKRFRVEWPDASPFDGVTKLTSHNASRYSASVPDLRKFRLRKGMATRTPDSEPGRFYRQVMGEVWDGERHSYKLAVSRFHELTYKRQRKQSRLSVASDAALTAVSAPTGDEQSLLQRQHARAREQAQHLLEQGREKLRKVASKESANVSATLASIELQPLAPPLKLLPNPPSSMPPSLPPSPPDSDGEEDGGSGGGSGGALATLMPEFAITDFRMAQESSGLPRHASAHGQEGGYGDALTVGGLPRHASAHGQEGCGGGSLTEGGLPRHASAHRQEGDGGGSLTEGVLAAAAGAAASAHGQEDSGCGTLTEGGLPRHAPAHGQEGGGGVTLTEGIAEGRERRRHECLERKRAEHAERQQQQPPELLIDFESFLKLERKAARAGNEAHEDFIEEAKEICPEWLAELRREFDGETRLTAENSDLGSQAPSLRDYRNKAKRTRDSLPARFYRMMMGEEWDGEGHSYSLARKKYRRWEEDYQQRERERQQRTKRDYSKKKRPADDNAQRQARRKAQREREKATLAASTSAHGQDDGGDGTLTEGGLPTHS